MLGKSFLSSNSRKLVNVSHIMSYWNTKLIENKCIRHKFLLKQSIHRANCVTQFRQYSSNIVKPTDDDDLYDETYFSSQHEVVTSENQDRIFNDIAKGDPEIIKKLKILDFEVHVLREQFMRVPNKLTKAMFEELLERPSVTARTDCLKFFYVNENRKRNCRESRKVKVKENRMKYLERLKEGKSLYEVGKSSMFIRIYGKSIGNLLAQRQFAAQMFSQTIVFDCSYDAYMSPVKAKDCASQFLMCFTENTNHVNPFAVKVCNYDKRSNFCKYVHRLQDFFNEETHPWDFHSESFIDLFDKDRLVYLSPHSKYELKKWNHNDVYIIGAFVDKGTSVPASKVKYQELELRSARLPLDSYVKWSLGDKSLPLNTVMKILLDMRTSTNWLKAFEHIPRRKVCGRL